MPSSETSQHTAEAVVLHYKHNMNFLEYIFLCVYILCASERRTKLHLVVMTRTFCINRLTNLCHANNSY